MSLINVIFKSKVLMSIIVSLLVCTLLFTLYLKIFEIDRANNNIRQLMKISNNNELRYTHLLNGYNNLTGIVSNMRTKMDFGTIIPSATPTNSAMPTTPATPSMSVRSVRSARSVRSETPTTPATSVRSETEQQGHSNHVRFEPEEQSSNDFSYNASSITGASSASVVGDTDPYQVKVIKEPLTKSVDDDDIEEIDFDNEDGVLSSDTTYEDLDDFFRYFTSATSIAATQIFDFAKQHQKTTVSEPLEIIDMSVNDKQPNQTEQINTIKQSDQIEQIITDSDSQKSKPKRKYKLKSKTNE